MFRVKSVSGTCNVMISDFSAKDSNDDWVTLDDDANSFVKMSNFNACHGISNKDQQLAQSLRHKKKKRKSLS